MTTVIELFTSKTSNRISLITKIYGLKIDWNNNVIFGFWSKSEEKGDSRGQLKYVRRRVLSREKMLKNKNKVECFNKNVNKVEQFL